MIADMYWQGCEVKLPWLILQGGTQALLVGTEEASHNSRPPGRELKKISSEYEQVSLNGRRIGQL
jgi:hypothetical protein